jgi:hypothetical protein
MAPGDPRTTLIDLAAAGGTSLAALSRMLGRNPAYIQQYVRRRSPRVLEEADIAALARFFGVDPVRLGAVAAAPWWRVPRLDVAVSAGPGALIDAEVVTGTDLLDPGLARRLGLQPDKAAIVRVRGDSMEPGLRDGDHILVDTADRQPGPRGGIFVVRIDGTVMVKRITLRAGTPRAASDNPQAPPLPDAPVELIGRVVWQMRVPA